MSAKSNLSSRRLESLNRSESVVPRRSDNGGRPPCRRSGLFGEALLWLLIGWGEFGFVDGLFWPDEIITNGLVLTRVLTIIFRPFITRPVISWSDLSWWNFSIGLIRRSISSIKIAFDLVGPRRERKDGFKGVASSGDDSDSKTKNIIWVNLDQNTWFENFNRRIWGHWFLWKFWGWKFFSDRVRFVSFSRTRRFRAWSPFQTSPVRFWTWGNWTLARRDFRFWRDSNVGITSTSFFRIDFMFFTISTFWTTFLYFRIFFGLFWFSLRSFFLPSSFFLLIIFAITRAGWWAWRRTWNWFCFFLQFLSLQSFLCL